MDRTGYIYGLVDPQTNDVRYVGQTVCDLRKRLHEHLTRPTNKHVNTWISGLKNQGLRPTMRLLEIVDVRSLTAYERYWIAEMCYQKAPLLNVVDHIALEAWYGRRPPRPF